MFNNLRHRFLFDCIAMVIRPISTRVNLPALIYILTLHCLALLSFFYHSLAGIYLLVGLYFFTGFGVTIGYHRLLTHYSFQTSLFLRRFLAIAAALAGQGGPLFWVSTHRLHHAFADQDGDPHDARCGFLWSHIAWTILNKDAYQTDLRRVEDLASDAVLRWIDRWHLCLQLLLALFVFVVATLTSNIYSGIAAVIWAIPLRIVLVLHCTWLTNSAAHLWGRRRFETLDKSHNNFWIALLTLGEGWHNNHHAFPSSARHGLAWYEFDPSWQLIKLLRSMHMITKVKVADLPSRVA